MKAKATPNDTGCVPWLQGYWWAVYGEPRIPPNWLPGHQSEEYKREWLRGYDEYKARQTDDTRRS